MQRTLWVGVDGRAYTANEPITGTFNRASRLSMLPPTSLGRVAIDGKDQLITRLDADPAKAGVEVRQGELQVTADSRIGGDPESIPAVGYDHDFHQVTTTLHLPPGFRLFHASGADDVPGTWVHGWTLLELFLVLVLSLAFGKLFGRGWGVLAGVTFTLVFPETDAAQWIWPFALASEALSRAVPVGKARLALSAIRVFVLVLLVLATLPFIVQHVREGIYPALAAEQAAISSEIAPGDLSAVPAAPPPVAKDEPASAQAAEQLEAGGGMLGS